MTQQRTCRSLMTLNRKGSIAAFSISKSVEPNEEQKVLISDSEQEITASTERVTFRGFLGISNRIVKASNIKGTESNKWPNPFLAKERPSN